MKLSSNCHTNGNRDLPIDRAIPTGQPLENFYDIVELLKHEEFFRELIPELTNLEKIMLALPASSCTAERSISDLRLKNLFAIRNEAAT